MTELLKKATALLEAREKATQGAIRIEEIVSDLGGRYQAATTDYSCDILTGKRLDLDFFAIAANTSAEIITGYQELVRRMADALTAAELWTDPENDVGEWREAAMQIRDEARAAILHTSISL